MMFYGGCVEPEGWHEQTDTDTGPCPECGDPECEFETYERAEGSLNTYTRTNCCSCGYSEDTGQP